MQAVAFPLETVARRLQVNGGSNFAALTAQIVREGGPAALYRCERRISMQEGRMQCCFSWPCWVECKQTAFTRGAIVFANVGVTHGLQGHRRGQPEGGAHGVRQLWDV
jgi:hypothetical protein